MGGTIAIAIRKPDGTTTLQHRWTNPLPHTLRDPAFYDKETRMAYVEKYIRQGKKDPYKSSGARLAPYSYGLLVIDLVRDQILHMNGYSAFVEPSLYEFSREYPSDVDESAAVNWWAMSGRILGFTDVSGDVDVEGKGPLDKAKLDELAASSRLRRASALTFLKLNTTPYTVTRFKENPENSLRFRQTVLDLGFTLTPEDIKAWDKFDKERWGEDT